MKSDIIRVSTSGTGFSEALALTEKTGTYCGLDTKQNLRLRLLAEEMIGLLRGSIANNFEADYWVYQKEKKFELHLKANINLTSAARKEIISVSSSGSNKAARGFMGKIREFIAVNLLSDEARSDITDGFSYGLMYMGSPSSYPTYSSSYIWSLRQYATGVADHRSDNAEAEEAYDELEKSIVANIADEIEVSIQGSVVEIIIYKQF